MNGQTKPTSGISLPPYSLVALILAASGILYWAHPLVTSRPSGPALLEKAPENRVPARLWQDPLQAVREGIGSQQKASLVRPTAPTKKDYRLLPVMIPGGNSPDDQEERLRTRYAVLTALDSAGYFPEENATLGFFCPKGACPGGDRKPGELPPIIPYEWLRIDPLLTGDRQAKEDILLLWLDSTSFEKDPFKVFYALLSEVAKVEPARSEIHLLGPTSSNELRAMLEDFSQMNCDSKQDRPCISIKNGKCFIGRGGTKTTFEFRVYSSRATADEAIFSRICSIADLNLMSSDRREQAQETAITRTIASDREVVRLLVKELDNRRVLPKLEKEEGKIAILSEWDTLYGRALPLTFATHFVCGAGGCDEQQFARTLEELTSGKTRWPEQILRIMYLKGLDGISLSGPAKSTDSSKQKKQQGKEEDGKAQLERPEGASQLDYVRRIADRLATEGHNLKAVGVLGSDVYDKLLLLQALRPRLPHAVFFTTDLDARLLHPDEAGWARNLIVASSYSLDVNDSCLEENPDIKRLQLPGIGKWARHEEGQPPFRDSYQTALYFTTLRALGVLPCEAVRKASEPKLYEVGRTGAQYLPNEGDAWTLATSPCHAKEFSWLLWGAAVGILVLLYGVLSFIRRGPDLLRQRAWQVKAFLFVAFLALTGLAAGIIYLSTRGTAPEPFAWIEGISIWPTELLRLLAAFLALHFLMKAHYELKANHEELRQHFSLPASSHSPANYHPEWWRRFCCSLIGDWNYKGYNVVSLWMEYRRCSQWRYRWARILSVAALYFILGFALFEIFGKPVTPGRGSGSLAADVVALALSVVLLLALILYVLDATLMCERFVNRLCDDTTRRLDQPWLEPDSKTAGAQFPGAWKTVDLVAHHTAAVSKLICYPFLVLAIMIVSRLSYFDRWEWPISLIAVFGLNSLFAIACAFLLRHSAERARQQILAGLQHEHIKAAQANDATKVKLIEIELDDIRREQRGAFAPLSQHPILGAVLLPFSGVSLAVVMEKLATYWP